MSAVSERREVLLRVVDQLRAAHQEWAADNELIVLSEDLWERLDECCEVFASGDLPGELRSLASSVDKLREEWERYKLTADEQGSPPIPENSFWLRLENVVKVAVAAKPHKVARLETIKELTEQKVGDNQICRMYGWEEDDGRPQLWKLREERDEPGKHTGAGFVTPQERARLQREELERKILADTHDNQSKKLNALTKVGKESLSELVAEGLSAKQIGKVKKISVEEVLRQCDELGIDRPPVNYDDVRLSRSPKEPEPNPEAIKAMDTPRSGRREEAEKPAKKKPGRKTKQAAALTALQPETESEIIAYRQQGMEIGEILDAMEPRVSREQVEACVNAYAAQDEELANF